MLLSVVHVPLLLVPQHLVRLLQLPERPRRPFFRVLSLVLVRVPLNGLATVRLLDLLLVRGLLYS